MQITTDRIYTKQRKDKSMIKLFISMNKMNQQQQLIVKTDNGLFVLCS